MTKGLDEYAAEKGLLEPEEQTKADELKEKLDKLTEAVKEKKTFLALSDSVRQAILEMADLANQAFVLEELVREELKEAGIDEDANRVLLEGLADSDEMKAKDGPYKELIEKAIEKLSLMQYEEFNSFLPEPEAVKVTAKGKAGKAVDMPVGKVPKAFFDLINGLPTNGQETIVDTRKTGTKKPAIVVCSLNLDDLPGELHVTKKLTEMDKRIMMFCSAFWEAGRPIFSLSQLAKAMGFSGSPNGTQIKKLNNYLTKLGMARVTIDNTREITVHKTKAKFKEDENFLSFRRVSAIIDGQLTEAAICMDRDPIVMRFAKARGEVTPIPIGVYQAPVSKTPQHMQIEGYLLDRIVWMKNKKTGGRANHRILFDTLFEACSLEDKKQKTRAKETARIYLEHFTKTEFIKGYSEDKEGITVLLEEPKQIAARSRR